MARLSEASERASDEGEQGQTLVLLARAAADQGNAAVFDGAVAQAQGLLDRAGPSGILFTPFAWREVRMRGLLQTGRADQAARLAHDRPAGRAPAPQWETIEEVTSAAALASTGDLDGAGELYRRALSRACQQRLPHQIQRIRRHTHAPGHEAVNSEAQEALRNLRLPSLSAAPAGAASQ